MSRPPRQSNTRLIWAISAFILCVWVGSVSFGQTADDTIENTVAAVDAATTEVAGDDLSALLGIDHDLWTSTASRIEALLLRGDASAFALDRVRTDLTSWRDIFADAMEENAARLTTINSQIAALGPVPAEDETEATAITARRDELIAFRDTLAAPGLLAGEAHARAAGMISEIEAQLRARQTAALMVRSVSPLNPVFWPDAFGHFFEGVKAIGNEVRAGFVSRQWTSATMTRALWALLAIGGAFYLFRRGHRVQTAYVATADRQARDVLSEFTSTVLQALLPLLGLVLLTYGLGTLDVFGVRGEIVLSELPLTGSTIILASWLGKQFFPMGDRYGPLDLAPEVRMPTRRTAVILAWAVGLWWPYSAFVASGSEAPDAVSVLYSPFIVIVSIVLFRFATLLRNAPDQNAGEEVSLGRTRSVVGRLLQLVALAAPILAVLGFDPAARSLLFPTCLTVGLLGVIVYLQTLSYSIYDLLYGLEDGRKKALVPVVVGFVLFLLSLPIVALIWGAEQSDLWSIWSRFTAGFAVGETRISPSDFLMFVLIFGIGYLLTGFIKTSLRSSVLPRTSLDLGAQDAIVAGFGYVGIFLAAVAAITSAGIDLSNLAIVAGALSVGIGFGLQTIVSNFVSGIILLIERPVSQGDWIEVGDRMGYVRSISVRSTRIETFDRSDVIVPNADLISNQVINWTRGNLAGRLILPIGVAYGTDVDRVANILREIAEAHPMVIMTPPPAVMFMNFGADALEFEIRAILRDVNFVVSVRSELNFEISRRFAVENIEIPFAQRDIWLRNPEVLRQSERNDDIADTPRFEQDPQRDMQPSEPDAGDST